MTDPVDTQAMHQRLASADWDRMATDLDRQGWSVLPAILSAQDCESMAGLYDQADGFRSQVIMARHGFGRGEYRYFAYPLPDAVQALRAALYRRLAPIANRWHGVLGISGDFPASHADYLARCHAVGQARPTPLLLRYGPGDYNCLHQDLYGAEVFPLQAALLLSQPGQDFEGGELILTEQRPRMQSRAMVVPARQGDMVVFAVNHRPNAGARGTYRTTLRHGVSEVRSGRRHVLGIILHDAA
ncbi:MAG: proline hydroxylase [Caulobacteraceae bacterium]|nr:proline hydroxylase [Caulobacteraceae bacterium]